MSLSSLAWSSASRRSTWRSASRRRELQDLVAAALRWRSRTLAAAIRETLDPAGRRGDPRREIEAAVVRGRRLGAAAPGGEPVQGAVPPPADMGAAGRDATFLCMFRPRELAAALLDLLARAGGEDVARRRPARADQAGQRSVGSARARTVLTSMLRAAEAAEGRRAGAGGAAARVPRRRLVRRGDGARLRVAIAGGRTPWHSPSGSRWRWPSTWTRSGSRGRCGVTGCSPRRSAPRSSRAPRERWIAWPGSACRSAGGRRVPVGPDWALWLLGILLTAAAVAQGSPIWFDVLKRITSVRMAGRGRRAAGRQK